MGKTYRNLKESYDYGTIIGGAYANLFNKLAEAQADGRKFREMEDIVNSIWATLPTPIKRRKYHYYGSTYLKEWHKAERIKNGGAGVQSEIEAVKRRVWAKMQILSDLFFNERIWVRVVVMDEFDEEDYELIIEEEMKNENPDEENSLLGNAVHEDA